MRKCWYIPGYAHPYLLAIKVKIEEQDGNSFWLDEPIGHGVLQEELLTKEGARKELAKRKSEPSDFTDRRCKNSTLHDWRIHAAKFILSTRKLHGDKRTVKEFLADFPDEKKVEWFV
jgi:hypothetical protein